MICKYAEIFCWKNVSSFCNAKATHIFSAKNIRILCIESAKTVNEMTLNELVKLTTLWTTGPRFAVFSVNGRLKVCGCAVWSGLSLSAYSGRHFYCLARPVYPNFTVYLQSLLRVHPYFNWKEIRNSLLFQFSITKKSYLMPILRKGPYSICEQPGL